jgi:16S rRNA (adenine1518-N6/adenine1519-N6)-dimethyltransferase
MRAYRDQHFLTDPAAIARIASLIELNGRTVLEIGPGGGALTAALLQQGARVRAVELDRDLCELLADRFSQEIASGALELIRGDATKCPLPVFECVVSNLPYSASSKITFRLLETGFEVAVLMYQQEYASRMLAPAGTPDCGRLSVMMQTYTCMERCFDLPPHCFSPRPQVRSTVMKIIPRGPLFPIRDRRFYADVVRALFSHRRKTVRNGLRGSPDMLPSDWIGRAIAALPGEILKSRPEELYLEDFATIANLP